MKYDIEVLRDNINIEYSYILIKIIQLHFVQPPPPLDFFFYCNVVFFPNYPRFTLSLALSAVTRSSIFLDISSYLYNALLANYTNASSTFLFVLADVSIKSKSPFSWQNLCALTFETYLLSSSKSSLLPITMNGKLSGIITILLSKNDFFH